MTDSPVRPGPVYLTVLVISTCGLVYELVAGALASYLLGDTVTQFSLVIGMYLTAMGAGAWLSKFVEKGLARRFVEVEIAVAFLGGFSAPILSFAFVSPRWFHPVFYGLVFSIGVLVGLEIPLMLRLLRRSVAFKDLVAQVLTFDYLGALVASLLFPLVFVPRLGLFRTSLLFGLLNAAVAFASIRLFRSEIGAPGGLLAKAAAVTALLLAGFVSADRLSELAEEQQYADEVLFARSSAYQRVVLTRNRAGFQLFLNGHLQFSSVDEYRYHEALVHPAFAVVPGARRIAVLGGGDGLAVREILRHPSVASVTLVDLDPMVTRLARENPLFSSLNGGSLRSAKVTVVNDDAMKWLEEGTDRFDLVFVDFPDPNGFAVGKLYTKRFYTLLKRRLSPDGAFAVQSTSPLFARRSFWIINRTIAAAGFTTRPYHAAVPSFGEWGFVLAAPRPFDVPPHLLPGLRYLSDETLPALFSFGPDMARWAEAPVNRLHDQALVRTYEAEWRKFE
ncbi:MAG: polyamine aminopropyltransferase [Thermoanaerobaculia bacterium]